MVSTASAFHFTLFPTANDLQDRSNDSVLTVTLWGNVLICIVCVTVGVLGFMVFGSDTHSSFLDDFGEIDSSVSYIIRVAFLIIVLTHYPFIFFPGKDGLLLIFDEVKRGSISQLYA